MELDRCRTLLLTLDDDDLRCRLSESPWCQSSVTVEESWLREAALAFETRTKAGGVWKKRNILVEDVLTAVQKAREGYENGTSQEQITEEAMEEAEIEALWSDLGITTVSCVSNST